MKTAQDNFKQLEAMRRDELSRQKIHQAHKEVREKEEKEKKAKEKAKQAEKVK